MALKIAWPTKAASLLVVSAFILTACGGDTQEGDAQEGDEQETEEAGEGEADDTELRVRIGSDIVSLDPHDRATIEGSSVQVHIFDALITYDYETMEFEPQLATEWSISDDGMEFVFKLDPNAKWHGDNGTVTAEDVRYSIERVQDPDQASPHAFAFDLVEEIEVIDAGTVALRLSEPDANFLHHLAAVNQALILPKDYIDEVGEQFASEPIGSGPYVFDEWVSGQGITLAANPNYYGPQPGFDVLEFVLISEETVAETALGNREIDVYWALQEPQVIDRLRSESDILVQETESLVTCYMAMDTRNPPFDDVRVRQAAAYGTDMRALVEEYFEGAKAIAYTPLTPSHAEFTDDVPAYEYDPDRAKELLAEAGYAEGEAPFNYSTLALKPFDEFPVPLMEDLRRAGFDASLEVLERAEFGESRSVGALEAALGCPPNGPHPDITLRQVFHSDNFPPGWNMTYYDGVDDMLDAARAEQDDERRIELYQEVQKQIMEDVPLIPLYTDTLYQAHHDGVADLPIPPIWYFDSKGARPAN